MAADEVKIIYEDQWLLIVEKPWGMVTTRELDIRNGRDYLEDWVGGNFPNDLPRKGIVHRLDKDTSGLVMVAKNNEVMKKLKEIFKQRKVVKRYLALVGGDLPMNGGVNMPIGRNKYFLGRFKVDVDGKSAVTDFRVVKKMVIEGKKCSLVEVDLKTGRTHQIRVHFSYLGWPLIGDKTYKGMEVDGLKRQFLHSHYMQFTHPITEKMVEVLSNLPGDLEAIVKKYEN